MDGSEDSESLPAAVLSGAPIELQARTVRYVSYNLNTFLVHFDDLNNHAASTNHQNPPRSLEPGVLTNGEWIGTFWPRDTDGRTR